MTQSANGVYAIRNKINGKMYIGNGISDSTIYNIKLNRYWVQQDKLDMGVNNG